MRSRCSSFGPKTIRFNADLVCNSPVSTIVFHRLDMDMDKERKKAKNDWIYCGKKKRQVDPKTKEKKMKIRKRIMYKMTKKYLNVLCRDIGGGRQNKLHFPAASKSPWTPLIIQFKCNLCICRNQLASLHWQCGKTCPSWPDRLPTMK